MVLFTCCFSLFMGTLDNTIVNVALPSIQRSLHADESQLQWVVAAYILVRASLILSAGAVADRFGRRRVFCTGMVLFTVGSLLCSAAPSAGALVALRMVQGVGGAMLTPASLAIIANTFTKPAERAKAIGLWSATTGASTGLGPVVGGALVDAVGWRSVFWVNVPFGILAVLLARRVVQESRSQSPRRLDLPGQVLAIGLLASLTAGLIDAPAVGFGALSTVLLLCAFAVLSVLFVLVERGRRQPLLELSILRDRAFVGASAVAMLAFLVFSGFIFFNTLYLQDVRGATPLIAGLLTMPATVGSLVIAPLSGRLTGSIGPRLPMGAACGCLLAGMAILSTIAPGTPIGLLICAYLLIGAGVGLVNPPVTNVAVSSMPPDRAGVAGATTATARQVGSILGVALLGSVVFSAAAGTGAAAAFSGGLRHGYMLAGALAFLALMIVLRLMRRSGPGPRVAAPAVQADSDRVARAPAQG